MLEGSSSLGIWAEHVGCMAAGGSQGDAEGVAGTSIVLAIAPAECKLGTDLLWTEEKTELAERPKWSS